METTVVAYGARGSGKKRGRSGEKTSLESGKSGQNFPFDIVSRKTDSKRVCGPISRNRAYRVACKQGEWLDFKTLPKSKLDSPPMEYEKCDIQDGRSMMGEFLAFANMRLHLKDHHSRQRPILNELYWICTIQGHATLYSTNP